MNQAVLIAIPFVLGYAISTAFILGILSSINNPYESKRESSEVLVNDLLYDRYHFEGYQFRYADTPHPSALASIVFVLMIVFLGMAALHRLPVHWSRVKMQNMPRNDRAVVGRLWKVLLAQPKSFSIKLSTGLVVLGFVGAWVGLAADISIWAIRYYKESHSSVPILYIVPMPSPFIGWFTVADISWVIALLLLMLYVFILRPARKRIARSHYINKRWCRNCGYPIAQTNQNCPECGGVGREKV